MAKISIVIPVYRIQENNLRICIESIIKLRSQDVNIILVDDGSPDNCGAICDEYANLRDNITVIHQQNSGVSVARNAGIAVSRTEWITFVDPDDWIEPLEFEKALDFMEIVSAEADMIMFPYVREYTKNLSVERLEFTDQHIQGNVLRECRMAPFNKLYQNGKVNKFSINAIWNKLYKRSFLLNNGIFFIPELRKGQDRIFNALAVNSTDKIYYSEILYYHYRCSSESVTNKFNKNILEYTKIEVEQLSGIIEKFRMEANVKSALACRTCTRLYSCMRLYYFHRNNNVSFKQKIRKAKKILKYPLFRKALNEVDYKLLSFQEKVFVFSVKHNMLCFTYLLVKFKDGIFSRKLS